MSPYRLQTGMMAPDNHSAIHDTTPSPFQQDSTSTTTTTTTTDPSVLLTLMAIGPTPSPPSSLPGPLLTGILAKGSREKKTVSFRDSNLVTIREIPPRPRRASSSEEEEEEEDEEEEEEDSDEDEEEEEDSASSGSDDDSDESGSEEEEGEKRKGARRLTGTTMNGRSLSTIHRDRALIRTQFSPSPPNSSFSLSRAARADRSATVPAASSVNSAKGSYHVSSSPATRVVSLVSQITGVSSAATQTHIKQRNTAAAVRKTPGSPKQMTAVLKVDKKVTKISPSMDSAASSQTVSSVQSRDRALAVALAKGSQGKGSRKKRISCSLRRQDGSEKRKPAIPVKVSKNVCRGGHVNEVYPRRVKCRVTVNSLTADRDSVSLPPLGSDEAVLVQQPSSPSSHTAPRRTPVFGADGCISPNDSVSELPARVKVKASMTPRVEVARLAASPSVSRTTVAPSPKERMNSAPPGSPGRRKRCHAWQMANGDLQNSLQEPPSITPMWDTVSPVTSHTAKPLPLPNR